MLKNSIALLLAIFAIPSCVWLYFSGVNLLLGEIRQVQPDIEGYRTALWMLWGCYAIFCVNFTYQTGKRLKAVDGN